VRTLMLLLFVLVCPLAIWFGKCSSISSWRCGAVYWFPWVLIGASSWLRVPV
jgi:hypothetical protein